MKILHVISGLGMGGAETTLWKLLSLTDRSVFRSEVLSLSHVGVVGESIRELGIPVRSIDLRRAPGAPFAFGRLLSTVRRAAPDVVQTWLYHADLLGGVAARLVTRAPVVWNLRHSGFDSVRPKRSLAWTLAACARLSSRVPARIVSCSEEARRVHAALGYPKGRMVVIPNGFDLERFRPDPAARAAVRRELGVGPGELVVGVVGRYHPHKDHETLFAAAARVLAARHDIRFVLCGGGLVPENRELGAMMDRAGIRERVILLGRREDVPRLTTGFDVACSSSASEAFSNVVGESMACGVPCVVTDVGDSAGIVADTGRVVPRRSPERLASALLELLRLEPEWRRSLGEAARRRIEERYSLPRVVGRYEALYREVAYEATQARGSWSDRVRGRRASIFSPGSKPGRNIAARPEVVVLRQGEAFSSSLGQPETHRDSPRCGETKRREARR